MIFGLYPSMAKNICGGRGTGATMADDLSVGLSDNACAFWSYLCFTLGVSFSPYGGLLLGPHSLTT